MLKVIDLIKVMFFNLHNKMKTSLVKQKDLSFFNRLLIHVVCYVYH